MIVGYETNLKKFMRKEQQGALSSSVVIYNKKASWILIKLKST